MMKIKIICRKFENGVGFSKGCAELAWVKPPPLVPIILMASCEASGPCGSVCTAPSTVATLVYGWKFWIAPCETNSNAPTTESGNRTYTVERTKSTQKLPSVCAEWRAKPEDNARG